MTEAEKYATLIEKIPKVNEAGKNSMLKYHPEATVSGSIISLNDVSELPHEVKCKISGVDDPTKVSVTRTGKNMIKKLANAQTSKGITYTADEYGVITANGTINEGGSAYSYIKLYPSQNHITGKVTVSGMQKKETGISLIVQVKKRDGTTKYYYVNDKNGVTFQCEAGDNLSYIEIRINNSAGTVIENLIFKPQLEFGEVATEYEPYSGTTYTPNADGTVEGMTSVSPFMNIFTDTEGANIEATYRKSKGMEVEKEQFYNNFKTGYITDSISFEWMIGLGRTNTALIVGGLSDNATGQTLTLNLAGVNKAYETSSGANDGATSAAFAELVATKPNWTITLI